MWAEHIDEICTTLIKMIHRCVLEKCPRFGECNNKLSLCILRQPRKVERDPWEVWQFVLNAIEHNGGGSFLETKYPYDKNTLLEILESVEEDLACEHTFDGDRLVFTI